MEPLRILHPLTDPHALAAPEWLVANGLGGYACGTVSGPPIRRYHGLLIAALPPPLGRTIMLNRLLESVHCADGTVFGLGTGRDDDAALVEFRLEAGLPVWVWRGPNECEIERRLVMPHGENRTHLSWRVLKGAAAVLHAEPWVQMRPHWNPVDSAPAWGRAEICGAGLRIECPDYPALHVSARSPGAFAVLDEHNAQIYYANEAEGGDPSLGPQWSPGRAVMPLTQDQPALLCLSEGSPAPAAGTDPWRIEAARRQALIAQAHPALRRGTAAELVLAADSFLVEPVHRGAEGKTILAGYHWFSDWGRDSMIALEGLTLCTGRSDCAGPVLESFAALMRDGLIPNMFPDGRDDARYNTADAGLWFFHAVDRVVRHTQDLDLLKRLMPVLTEMMDAHRRGTRFGIGEDPADGLMRQGEDGLQLTWMDAKVEDWVVTPRRGKAVEINALWYNAQCCMAGWLKLLGRNASDCEAMAARTRDSFNARFPAPDGDRLFDVIDGPDGDDPSLRPNQVFAISLPHAVLEARLRPAVLRKMREELLTPVGLRSASRDHPEYKSKFLGDRWARDGAYHQGTVWAWLMGPFVEAWVKTFPQDADFALSCLDGLADRMSEFGAGSIGEVFDAEPPHAPRGCISQAWSVAEWLRTRACVYDLKY